MPGTQDWGAPITRTLDQVHHHLACHHQHQDRGEMTTLMVMMMMGTAMVRLVLEHPQEPMTVAMETIWM